MSKKDKITKLYFVDREIPATIARKLNISKSAVTQVLQKDDRYKKENFMDFNFDFIEEFENDIDEDEDLIVKRKTIEVKPMDEEEAILQMELLNHDFFMFKNIDEDCISVLYRRKDGKFGILNSN